MGNSYSEPINWYVYKYYKDTVNEQYPKIKKRLEERLRNKTPPDDNPRRIRYGSYGYIIEKDIKLLNTYNKIIKDN
jgi:hypothetical protein